MKLQTKMLLGFLLLTISFHATPQNPEFSEKAPDYSRMMLMNQLLPGTAQMALGQKKAGTAYLISSLALSTVGQGLLVYYYLTGPEYSWEPHREDGRTYLYRQISEGEAGMEWMVPAGFVLSTWGSLIGGYSSYAAHRDWLDRYGRNQYKKTTGRSGLAELFMAPYDPEVVFSREVFPVFPLTVLLQMDGDDLNAIGGYFSRDYVDFFGYQMQPLPALAANTLFAFGLVTANATVEEVLFRGLSLETNGLAYSSISFGIAHLPNMLMPGTPVEDTLLQTAFASLFGLYAGRITLASDYDLRKATALHFWHNIAAFTLSHLTQEHTAEDAPAFTIGLRGRFAW